MAVFVVVLLWTSACNPLEDLGGDITVRSDRSEYQAGESITITIDNASGRSIFFYPKCSAGVESVRVEQRLGETWEDVMLGGVGCRVDYDAAIEVPARRSHKFFASFEEVGEFRYRLGIYETHERTELLPREQRTSNPFIVSSAASLRSAM